MTQPTRSPSFAILLVLASIGLAWTQPNSERVAELKILELELAQAWIDGDRGAVSYRLAEDWKTTDINGRLRSKHEVLDEMFGPTGPDITEMELDELEVRLFGNVAIITGRNRVATADGFAVALRFTDVAERRLGRWVFVASQGTPIVD